MGAVLRKCLLSGPKCRLLSFRSRHEFGAGEEGVEGEAGLGEGFAAATFAVHDAQDGMFAGVGHGLLLYINKLHMLNLEFRFFRSVS